MSDTTTTTITIPDGPPTIVWNDGPAQYPQQYTTTVVGSISLLMGGSLDRTPPPGGRNIEMLNRVMDFIDANPGRHRQDIWVDTPAFSGGGIAELIADPNTCGCFAGWSVLLHEDTSVNYETFFASAYGPLMHAGQPLMHIAFTAQRILGLSDYDCHWLFNGLRTRAELRQRIDAWTAEAAAADVDAELETLVTQELMPV
jgi:hypothetical protein